MDSKSVIDMALTFSESRSRAVETVSKEDFTGGSDGADQDGTDVASSIDELPIRPFAYREPIGKGSTSAVPHPNRRRTDALTRGK